MKGLRLYKKEKLRSVVAIEQLFGTGRGAEFARLCYPLRVVARRNPRRSSDAPIAFLISVPKKRLRHAVDRVTVRRRVREAYRLRHQDYALEEGVRLDVAFVYVGNKPESYEIISRAMGRLLRAISETYPPLAGKKSVEDGEGESCD